MKDLWHGQEQKRSSRRERRGVRSFEVRSQLSLLGGREELKPQATRKVDFRGLEKRRNKAQNGVVFRQVTSVDV